MPAKDLQVGDQLVDPDGTPVTIAATEYDSVVATLHNVTVDTDHTYVVVTDAGTDAVTHNESFIDLDLRDAIGDADAVACPVKPRNAKGQVTSGAGGESDAAAAGRRVHENYGTALGADGNHVLNQRMPGSLDRSDAADYVNRVVRELKPDSPKAVAGGWRQVERYRKHLEMVTSQPWTACRRVSGSSQMRV